MARERSLLRGGVILALALYSLACLFLWVDREWHPEWDGAVYVLVARSLAAGEGYLYQGEPFFLRPPGLPWLLSFVVGPEGFDPYPVNLFLMAWAGLAACAIYFAVRAFEPGWFALAVALLTGTSLLVGKLFNSIFAEFPFAALAFLAIGLFERARGRAHDEGASPVSSALGARGGRWFLAIGAGLCIAAAITMRTVGVLMLPGLLLLPLVIPRGASRALGLVPVLLAGLLLAPWFRYSSAAAADAEVPVEQDLLYDYSTALFHVDPGDPNSPLVDLVGWMERISANSRTLLDDLVRTVLRIEPNAIRGALLAAVLFAGIVITLRRRGPTLLEWLFLVYVPLIATYFVYDSRLAMPLVPLAYLYLLTALRSAVEAFGRGRARPILIGLCGLLLLLNVVHLRRDLAETTHSGRNGIEMARGVIEHTPPDARILCNQAPTVALLTGRRTFTYRFRRSADPLTKYGIQYVLYDTANTPPPLMRMVEERRIRAWPIPFGDGRRTQLTRVR